MSYTSITGLPQLTTKYQCLVTGEKRPKPCTGCSNPTKCLVKTMHYKESTNMANETPTVKLLADGTIECAKGLELKDCGYKPGAKVCGKCGASAVAEGEAAVAQKSDVIDWSNDGWVTADSSTEEKAAKPKKFVAAEDDPAVYEEELVDQGAQETPVEEGSEDALGNSNVTNPKKKKKPAVEVMTPEKAAMLEQAEEDMPDDLDAEEEKMWDELASMMENRKKARAKRMDTMGVKSAEYDDLAFVCAIERKVYAGGSEICAQCPGGCEQQDSMPSLLEIEGMAESMFAGKVLDSGYADETDIFVVDVQRKDGKPIEAYFDGTSGECMGWHLLNEDLIGEVVSVPGEKVISFSEASSIAVKSIEGEVVSVDADMFEGYDAYAVEIEGIDGKSYDVYVGVDGEILGWDEYDAEEASDIDAEVADIALKRAYDEETRASMAKEGMALPDGSFPIKDESDLQNAIQAYGRAGDKAAAKAHIMKRAKELGKEDMIPADWNAQEKILDDAEAKAFLSELMEFELLALENNIDFGDDK